MLVWKLSTPSDRIKFLDISEMKREIGMPQKRLENATTEVRISGNDLKYVSESLSASINKLLAKGVRVKLLAVDPKSHVPDMLVKIDPRFEDPEQFKSSMTEVLNRLEEWQRSYSSTFEFRLLKVLPALGFFIIDPDSTEGVVKIEIYTAKEWNPGQSRPHIIISKYDNKWRKYFINQWENYWMIAKN